MPTGKKPSDRSVAIEKIIKEHCTKINAELEDFLKRGRGGEFVQGEISDLKNYKRKDVDNSLRRIREKFSTAPKKSSTKYTPRTKVSNNFADGESANKIQISLSITAAIEGNKENNTTLINDASIHDGQKKTSPAQAPAPAQHVEGIDDGQKEPPPAPVRYVEGVTTTNFVRGSLTEVKVYKPYADARLGIRTSDSQQGEVKILKIEDGSPMGPLLEGPLEVGMTIIAVNNEEITSSKKFEEIYNKCQVGKNVVIKVGPKKMSEALNIIEDLDRQRKLLENENQQLVRDNKDLENENQQLVRDNQRLQKQLEKQTADASHFRVMARTLEMTSLD